MTDKNDIQEEKLLLEQFRETQDLDLLGKLYQPYMHLVYGVCLKYLKDKASAQDAVMAIFEELVIKLPKHEVENFKSWLYVLSKNHCLMELRKQNRQKTDSFDFSDLELMENGQLKHHEEDYAVQDDNLEKLTACIAQLKKEQRQCVELFYLDKKSYQEITDSTSYELKKVKSYIQNAKRNLKQCMEQGEER
ncbi:DNA-directed RNA polymerase sigma-70 factor [Marivirga tractuosa]|uniref:RNA polymerase, sigma-24 subunit, ECF subfamily n=1 Tax=Marivirga tractuosa (strain ATCC 23168 / DSM 4126 / NBRC 15989 / NCIMB 1408 / VKM B-1430 / H-43) TaxID=643867 RepID=E4TLI9_MARTH|nr:sigma-70 family RNA polymerase sigma factor [Marivirga tractuosa]ADR22293.1 RNA polymerase, sigma-24 subunit, ECF subfamily [Marivirga tractuosa DSM 4126]BDD13240.1 DNA-directed RNA polymerase sigma-70 factor [Marivirga tractuosa]